MRRLLVSVLCMVLLVAVAPAAHAAHATDHRPVSAAAAGPVDPPRPVFFAQSPGLFPKQGNPTIRPKKVYFGVGGNLFLTGLTWRNWGEARAAGVGTAHLSVCEPTCAEGGYREISAELRVWRIGVVDSKRQYLCYELSYLETDAPNRFQRCLRGKLAQVGGNALDALLGTPGTHYHECPLPSGQVALCEIKLAGVGRGVVRALVRLGGYGSKALKGAKARLGRVGLSGLSARQLLGLERFARGRALQLQKLLPEVTQRKVTMAVGIGRDSKGFYRVVVASSERGGALRRPVREAVEEAGEAVARSPGVEHAEVRVLQFMQRNGLRPITLGAGNRICREKCLQAIARAGATAASKVRPPP